MSCMGYSGQTVYSTMQVLALLKKAGRVEKAAPTILMIKFSVWLSLKDVREGTSNTNP